MHVKFDVSSSKHKNMILTNFGLIKKMVCLQPNVISGGLWSGNVLLKTSDIQGWRWGDLVLPHYTVITLCSCQLGVKSSGARSACANLEFLLAREGGLDPSFKKTFVKVWCAFLPASVKKSKYNKKN